MRNDTRSQPWAGNGWMLSTSLKYRSCDENVVTDVVEEWPEDSVAFFVNCSFTCDFVLLQVNVSLRTV